MEGTSSVSRRYAHCAFCSSRWILPSVKCLFCGSTKAGDAKYFFTSDEPDLLQRVVSGEHVGTWIEPHESGLSARKLWIAFGLPAKGTLVVDPGAERAIVAGGKSLLAVGVVSASGSFEQGDALEVESQDGRLLAKGVVRTGSEDLDLVDGPLVHRDDLVVLTA